MNGVAGGVAVDEVAGVAVGVVGVGSGKVAYQSLSISVNEYDWL